MSRHELEIDATLENLAQVNAFVDTHLESADCSMKAQMQIDIAVEEIYVNITRYAYGEQTGKAKVELEITEDPPMVVIRFLDHGTPYDPLSKEDPDVTLAAEEREIGGLGIYMTKKSMDEVSYEYRDGQNILTLKKRLG